MRELNFIEKGRLEWREAPEPKLEGDGEAIVRPVALATCDLDAGIVSGPAPIEGPFPFGHECVAEVSDVGDAVSSFVPGDLVSVPFQISCGECDACRAGRTGNCESVPRLSMYGLPMGKESFGGFASDAVRVPFAEAMLDFLLLEAEVHVGYDPDLARLAARPAWGNTVRVLAPATGKEPGALTGHGDAVRGGEQEEGRREDRPRPVLRVAEEAPRPLARQDLPDGEIGELRRDVLEPRGHEVQEPVLGEAQRRPVELGVGDEARMLLTAGTVEDDLEHSRVLGAGESVEQAKGRQADASLASGGAGKRVPRGECVVHL